MNEEIKSQEQFSVNLLDVFSNMWAKKFLSLIIIVVFAAVGFVYGTFFVSPKYVSEAKMVVHEQSDKISSADISVDTYLVSDYVEMVLDRNVLEQVIKDLNLNMNYEQLKSRITITNPDNSRILMIKVSTSEPDFSRKIASRVCYVAKLKISEALGVDKVTIYSDANLPKKDTSVKRSTFAIIGAAAGLIVVFLLAVIFTSVDDKVKSSEDIEEYLSLPTLATIPYNSANAVKKQKHSRKAGKK